MILKTIELTNFRNYEHLKLNLDKNINILYGENGAGKTNILESIYVLAFTKSHRSFIEDNLIKEGKEQAIIKGTILKEISYNLEINITKGKKQIKIDNQIINKIGSYIEKMNIIIFCSDDLNLIKGYPSTRRKYLNLELSQISQTYYNALNDYNKLIKIRNDYLKQVNSKEEINNQYFDILNDYLIEKSLFIYKMRNKYINKLNKEIGEIFKQITKKEQLHIKYKTSINLENMSQAEMKKSIKTALQESLEKEIKYKTTMYGPHKDDIEFYLNENNLKFYGSQGQQRIAVLSLKLSEIKILKDYKKETPIILLDDVFSELDIKVRNNLLNYIDNFEQTIITTTDLQNIDKKIIKRAKLIKIENGKIQEEVEK